MLHRLIVLLFVSGVMTVAGCDRGQQEASTTAAPAPAGKSMEITQSAPAMPETSEHAEHMMEGMAEGEEMGEEIIEDTGETMADAAESLEDAAAEVSETAGEMAEEMEETVKKEVNEGIEAVKPMLDQ